MADESVDVLAADGSIVRLRPSSGADASALQGLYQRSSQENLRLRFFGVPGPGGITREVRRLTRAGDARHAAIVAEAFGQVIGVASYERERTGSSRAEFAVFVDESMHGRGIGTLLLEHLSGWARRAGIEELRGEVMPGNAKMLRLATDLSASSSSHFGAGYVDVWVPTRVDDDAVARADRRDRAAERASLRPLLAPTSVAVVGAGRTSGGVGHEVLRALLDYGFNGPVYPVNQSAEAVLGLPSFPSLAEIGAQVDLAVIAVPPAAVADVIADAARAGVKAVVILTAGFAELGPAGRALQVGLVELARSQGIRVLGPNCLGLVNADPAIRLAATLVPALPPVRTSADGPQRQGGLAVASQSGAVGAVVVDYAVRSGIDLSCVVSLGNKADVSSNDLLSYWYDDPATSCVALYLESFGNPRRFSRIVRSLARRKPVLTVFSGESAAGQRAGARHTASPTVRADMVAALFEQAGVVRAANLGDLLDAARMLTNQPLPAGERLGIVGNAGGVNILCADAAERAGLAVPLLSGAGGNPLDLGAHASAADFAQAIDAFARGGEVDTLLVGVAASRTNDPTEILTAVAQAADANPGLPLAIAALGAPAAATLGRRHVPVFDLPERAVAALAKAVRYAAWRRDPLGSRPDLSNLDAAGAAELIAKALAPSTDSAGRLRPPVESVAASPVLLAELLRRYGIEVAAGRAWAAAGHDEADRVRASCAKADEVELIAGVWHDPQFGSLVTLRVGGPAGDLIDDVTYRLTPLTDRDAARLWQSLRSATQIERAGAPYGIVALEELLMRLGRLAEDQGEVTLLELAPVLLTERGVTVQVASGRLAPVGGEPESVLRQLRSPK